MKVYKHQYEAREILIKYWSHWNHHNKWFINPIPAPKTHQRVLVAITHSCTDIPFIEQLLETSRILWSRGQFFFQPVILPCTSSPCAPTRMQKVGIAEEAVSTSSFLHSWSCWKSSPGCYLCRITWCAGRISRQCRGKAAAPPLLA